MATRIGDRVVLLNSVPNYIIGKAARKSSEQKAAFRDELGQDLGRPQIHYRRHDGNGRPGKHDRRFDFSDFAGRQSRYSAWPRRRHSRPRHLRRLEDVARHNSPLCSLAVIGAGQVNKPCSQGGSSDG